MHHSEHLSHQMQRKALVISLAISLLNTPYSTKTTQVSLLVKHLLSLSLAATAFRFPDRTTQGRFMYGMGRLSCACSSNNGNLVLAVGGLINQYLQSSVQTDDRAIHLLFSANRWEAAPKLVDTLARGTNIICDRYAYSGVAFTSAKTAEDRSSMSGGELTLDWCMGGDVGLPVSGSGSSYLPSLLCVPVFFGNKP